MMKRNDGYTLAYVVVVLFVLASVALATMSLALIPAKNQKNAQLRMQEKYEAQGMIEQVVAVLEHTTDDITIADYDLLAKISNQVKDFESLTFTKDGFTHITVAATVNKTKVTAELSLEPIRKNVPPQTPETNDTPEDGNIEPEVTPDGSEGNPPQEPETTIVGYTVKYLSYKTEVTP